MGPEMMKLAAKLKAEPCPYCGVRHAGKHNEQASTYSTQPKRRDTMAMTPPAKTAMEHLRDKLAQQNRLRDTAYTGGGTLLGGMGGAVSAVLLGSLLGGVRSADTRAKLKLALLLAGLAGGGAAGSHLGHHLAKKTDQAQSPDEPKTAMEHLRDKLAKMTPMQQHALSDAWRAQAQVPVSTQMPMRMNPQDALARQQMLQNPQMFAGGGGAPSGLELARPVRPAMPMMKRSQLELLREKLAIAPLVAGGLMAARAALPAIGRAVVGAGSKMMANPVGNMVGQQAMGMGMQAGMNKLMQPKQQGPLPGQIGGV